MISTIFTLASSAIALFSGIIYLVRPEFMAYHKEAVQKNWNELVSDMQTLLLALMRAVGGGFLTIGVAIIILQIEFDRTRELWIAITILIIGTVSALGTLYATILIRFKTKGRPPIFAVLLFIVMLLVGFLFNITGK